MNKELIFLRTIALGTVAIMAAVIFSSFGSSAGNKRFESIDVQRINIIEPDGTVKMIITNVDKFPTGDDQINGKKTNPKRKKRSGMLFFNEDGIECGGFIYDGKEEDGKHSSGLSLTYDQYDGDQVVQLLNTDHKDEEGNRSVSSMLAFNDRPADESISDGNVGRGVPRILLGKTRSKNNGLFLFDDQGRPKAMFYIDADNKAKIETYNDNMEVVHSWPE
ncbi:hypothetical protein HH304_15290 [Flammeovirgaceae bacterium KN852]|uniref:Uncharacterized protein n=2 Tax=Marinigracilibium pacificum TaxID=2729599 RepID=A0A848J219_9BACT|nr:hypothetical protein [Marinigracilibium pacificum]